MKQNELSRRSFLKGLLATGAATSLAGFNPAPPEAMAAPFNPGNYQIFRNACPRNCYDTCAMQSYVRDGVLEFVEGSPESSFTKNALCVKGYEYPRRVYSPDRVKYPMIQDKRGSGNWRRISWDEAMDRISDKILELKKKDGSLLGLGLTKYSGNFGITNYSIEGMMSSLGYTTRFVGTPCWPAGIDAQNYDMGDMWCNDPEDLVKARYIILWGANPAWCSMHSMKFIYEAKARGAKVVVIDPILTQTAAKADVYWQVNPGFDGALALGMCRHLVDRGLVNQDFVNNYALGYKEFEQYLKNSVTVEWAAEKSGIPAEQIRQVTEEFAAATPATVWIGYGLQRHTNGGATVRSVDAFVAMTGNIGLEGGGARYGQLQTWGFSYYGMVQKQPAGSIGYKGSTGPKGEFDFALEGSSQFADRPVNINKTAQEILNTKNPEIKMLWVSCKNPFAQDFDRNKMLKAFQKLEMVVTVDQFFNETVHHSDIVLPVTTLFEEWTVDVSYWHYWLSINEQAIKPMHEAKSNIEIAAALSRAMNAKEPGSCTFPQNVDGKEWMIKEFNKGIYDYFGIPGWEALRKGPVKAKLKSSAAWPTRKFKTPSGKYEFKSDLCAKNGFNALPVYVEPRKPTASFRLFSTHIQYALHSQFVNLDWMRPFYSEPFVFIHPEAAKAKGIADGDKVRVFNSIGEVALRAKLSDNVARDMLVMYECWFPYLKYNVQYVVDDCPSDMGAMKTGAPGAAILDQFVNIERVGG